MRKSKKGNYDIRTNKFSVSRMKEKKNHFDFKNSFIAYPFVFMPQ